MRITGHPQRSRCAGVLIALTLVAACSASTEDESGETGPEPSDRRQICRSTSELLVSEIEALPRQIDEELIRTMVRIHDEHRDTMATNDCDPAEIERVNVALCDHLTEASAVDELPLGTLEATASSFCAPSAAPSTDAAD
mgnify:CR=1 FL=1